METANDTVKEEVSSRIEAFVTKNGFRWFEVEKECNSMQFLALRELCGLAARNIRAP